MQPSDHISIAEEYLEMCQSKAEFERFVGSDHIRQTEQHFG